jgi:hypothetical protein
MLNPDIKDFVVAIVGASASFIGLLFVAISFVLNDEDISENDLLTRRILAESSYAALINIFFVGLVALIPNTSLCWVLIVMSLLGITTNLHYLRALDERRTQIQNWLILVFSMLIYTLELMLGVYFLIKGENHLIGNYMFMTLTLFLFGMALTRAWELTGIRPNKPRDSKD